MTNMRIDLVSVNEEDLASLVQPVMDKMITLYCIAPSLDPECIGAKALLELVSQVKCKASIEKN